MPIQDGASDPGSESDQPHYGVEHDESADEESEEQAFDFDLTTQLQDAAYQVPGELAGLLLDPASL